MLEKQFLCFSFVLSLFIASIKSQEIYFSKQVACSKETEYGCESWETNLKTFTKNKRILYPNLPSQTQLKGEFSPIKLADLKIGDRVYGYDEESKEIVLTEVIGWAERDEESEGEFVEIEVGGESYMLSEKCVIDISKEKEIEWTEIKDINGEYFGQKIYDISKREEKIKHKGRFAPITSIGNFIILPSSSFSVTEQKENDQMLLVNCFPKQSLPIENIFQFLFKLVSFLPTNPQPKYYMSPLIKLFSLLNAFEQQNYLEEIIDSEKMRSHVRKIERLLIPSSNNAQQRRNRRNTYKSIIEAIMTYWNPAIL